MMAPLLLVGGALAGTLGGLLGIGGGIVLMPMLRFVVRLSPARSAGTCILAVFFTTLGGSYRHHRNGHLELRSILPIMVSGAAACVVSSLAFGRLARRGSCLDLGIGLVFALISLRMIAEGIPGLLERAEKEDSGPRVRGTAASKALLGASAGVLPGLLGIGTGGVLVPAFSFLMHAPIKTATAASLACFCCNAAISSAFKLAQGYVALDVAPPICLGTLVGAYLGAVLNRRFPSRAVKLLFGLVFLAVSTKFFLASTGV
jgi:uncharacterized membrane protein YfcA